MGELDRLNEGIENLKRQIAATDKATGIDIAILKTQAALYGRRGECGNAGDDHSVFVFGS